MACRGRAGLVGTGIIYTLTVNDARRVAQWLALRGIDAGEYHADLRHDHRVELEERFLTNQIKCLVATTALGMGYDKPDVAFIIHFQRPGSVISYYQQIGRGGRSLQRARVILLGGMEDEEITRYFIHSAFPRPQCFREVLSALHGGWNGTVDMVTAHTNQPRGQVEKALKLLEVEEAVVKDKAGYQLVRDWRYESLRAEAITRQRLQEMEQMKAFVVHSGCRMEFLARALDDGCARACGGCDRCKPIATQEISRQVVVEALRFLRGDHLTVSAKAYFPPGTVSGGRTKIPAEVRVCDGLALCVYNDAGWGREVREGKYQKHSFSEALVEASAALILGREARSRWLTWVPSWRRPCLVSDFAQRLAQALEIEAVEAVRKVADHPEQKAMQNSTRQYLNVRGAFAVEPSAVRTDSCLLVDDVVDSAWTMTAIGILLREAGCERVVPFALAVARPRE